MPYFPFFGWAIFAYTPKGHNHGFTLFEAAPRLGWYGEHRPINDTKRDDGTPVITEKFIDSLRLREVDEDFIQQEYYCSFSGSTTGSYFGKQIKSAREQGRLGHIPYDPRLPVETWSDLGRNDATVIWFVQRNGREVRFIDYYDNRQEGLAHYVKVVREKEYVYSKHVFPHDINVTEYGSNVKRIDTARSLGLYHIDVAPKLHILEGIDAARMLLPRCYCLACRSIA